MRANVLALGEEADFGANHFQPSTNVDRSTKLQVCRSPSLTQNACVCHEWLISLIKIANNREDTCSLKQIFAKECKSPMDEGNASNH
jgi:hypothetical protein